MPKPRTRSPEKSLLGLLDQSSRPVYAIDRERRIVYCNPALAEWMGLAVHQIVGRFVEYHSASVEDDRTAHETVGLLTGLCPAPKSLAGEFARGTVSCVALDGRLVHRHAEFIPLSPIGSASSRRTRRAESTPATSGVLALVGQFDLTPQVLVAELSPEPSADELHRAIRRFRKTQAAGYALETLLGESTAIRKARAQVLAAAASGANVLIDGRRGTGRSHVARAIHYQGVLGAAAKLLPIDCRLATEDQWRRVIGALTRPDSDLKRESTLLLQNVESLPEAMQLQLFEAIRSKRISVRVIATCSDPNSGVTEGRTAKDANPPLTIDPRLLSELSTISVSLPRLAERLDDLPILAQFFLEECNRESDKQVGSIQPQALDLLALYSWPGELDELRAVVESAHSSAATHEIMPPDLPAVIHHAQSAASLAVRPPTESIVLDELLASIEKEAIQRALAQAGGNKTEAAALLGMTRPRLYRRLVQLGLVVEPAAEEIVFELESSEPE